WPSIWPGEKPERSSKISALMSAAALGARARPLPDGAGSWAASMACASSAGAALALAPPFLALALAASDIIRTAPAQMRATVTNLPMDMPIDERSAPSSLLRLLPPPTLRPRREVIAEAYEFRRRMSKFRSPAFPPRCGKSITVGIDPSSRMQGQFQGAWR